MLYDYYNLIGVLCEKEIDLYCKEIESEVEDLEDCILEEFLYNKYEISIDYFIDLIKDLIPLIDIGTSELTGKTYKGFGKNNLWIIKREI